MIYKRVFKTGRFPMFGSGKTFYHTLYIDNLIDALLLSMPPGVGTGQAYIIGDEGYVSIKELVQKVAASMERPVKINHYPITPLVIAGHLCEKACRPFGISPPIFPRRVDWYRQDRGWTIDKARKELGYQPAVSVDEGLRRTAEWYFAQGYLR